MFIIVVYKDSPELSTFLQRSGSDLDTGAEKTLLVNPECSVRVMLEYIRKKCKLGATTKFDLAELSGLLLGLFDLPTYSYATNLFQHKKTYYLMVLLPCREKRLSVIPQLNHDNDLYLLLQARVNKYIATGTVSPIRATSITPSKSMVKKPTSQKSVMTKP